jgi:hypothetical protein
MSDQGCPPGEVPGRNTRTASGVSGGSDAGGGERGRVHGPYKHEKAGQEPGSCNNAFQNAHFAGKGSGLSDNVKAGISALASLKP